MKKENKFVNENKNKMCGIITKKGCKINRIN